MKKQETIADARANLAELVRAAESGEPVELTRRGKPVAVLVGTRDYERLARRAGRFAAAFDAFRETVDLASLEIEPEDIFGGLRERSPGRAADLES